MYYMGGGAALVATVAAVTSTQSIDGRRVKLRGKLFRYMEQPKDGGAAPKLLVLNVGAFALQLLTKDRLLQWGCKVNALIRQGQYWRLVTPALLHNNLIHLLVNSYALHVLAPGAEVIMGTSRMLLVYCTAAITSNVFSYRFNPAPSVGASGAIMGLLGAQGLYCYRHKDSLRNGRKVLNEIIGVTVLNLLFGVLVARVDNWGHLGGLLGGIGVAWLVGPCIEPMRDRWGQIYLVDSPPLYDILDQVGLSNENY